MSRRLNQVSNLNQAAGPSREHRVSLPRPLPIYAGETRTDRELGSTVSVTNTATTQVVSTEVSTRDITRTEVSTQPGEYSSRQRSCARESKRSTSFGHRVQALVSRGVAFVASCLAILVALRSWLTSGSVNRDRYSDGIGSNPNSNPDNNPTW